MAPGIYNDNASPTLANSILTDNKLFDEVGHCERWKYPCARHYVSEDVIARTTELLNEAWTILDTGTLDDAQAHLANQPDVVIAAVDFPTLAFRVNKGDIVLLMTKENSSSNHPISIPSLPSLAALWETIRMTMV